jgi:uncharacterized MAPEG superfamily protein
MVPSLSLRTFHWAVNNPGERAMSGKQTEFSEVPFFALVGVVIHAVGRAANGRGKLCGDV